MLRKSAPPRALVRISRPDAEVWLERLRSAGFCTVDELPADLLLVADEGADAAIAETSRSKHAPAVVVADASAERVEPLLRAGAWAVLEHGTSELRCERRLERLARCVRQSREVEFLRRLVNAAPDVVFAADREHRILYINTSDEYIGRSVFDFVPPHHHTVLAHSLERVFEHGEEASHIVAQADIEPTVWWSTRLAPITEHDEVTMVAVVARDITEAMRVERELKATKTELEQRVVERTDELMQINAALRAEIVERKRLEEELRAVASLKKIFANTVIEAQEQERKRVARELHDAIGQVLVALKMDADWIDDKLGGDSELTTVARDLSGKLGHTIDAVRNVIRDLRPPMLDELGVSSALEAYANQLSRRTDVDCELSVSAEELPPLEPETATGVFRIGQEALNNAVRHAQAARVHLTLLTRDNTIVLTVEDNGSGIPDDALEARSSVGLMGMRERASLLRGRFTITARQGRGTTICAQIPLRPGITLPALAQA